MPLPQWVKQPHKGEESKLCAYYALVHFKGGGYTIPQFKKEGVAYYVKNMQIDQTLANTLLVDGNDPGMVQGLSGGGAWEKDLAKAIKKNKIIIPKSGHFLALLKDGGKWWNFDSWPDNGPTEIGDDKAVTKFLQDKTYKPVTDDGYIVG